MAHFGRVTRVRLSGPYSPASGSHETRRWREQDSNPRSPVGETDVGYPARPLRGRRMLQHAGGTADREIALLTGGNRMSRVLRPI